MRTPSPPESGLDLAPPWADRFINGVAPSITARYFSSCLSDPTSRWTPCPPEYRKKVAPGPPWPSPTFALGPFRLHHTFLLSPASEALPPLSDMAPLIQAPEGL